MSDLNYKPNSDSYREKSEKKIKEKKIDPVVSHSVKVQKKSPLRKLINAFVVDDMEAAKKKIVYDILVPKAIDTFEDCLHSVIKGGNQRGGYSSSRPVVSYDKMVKYKKNKDNYRSYDEDSIRIPSNVKYEDLIFEDRGDAERVLFELDELIDRYDCVSAYELYDAANVQTENYQLKRWGWINIQSATIKPLAGGGYLLRMPRIRPLD